MLVKELVECMESIGSNFEARSAYNNKLLFRSSKGKNYEKYKESKVSTIWSEIKANNPYGIITSSYKPVVCFSVVTGVI